MRRRILLAVALLVPVLALVAFLLTREPSTPAERAAAPCVLNPHPAAGPFTPDETEVDDETEVEDTDDEDAENAEEDEDAARA